MPQSSPKNVLVETKTVGVYASDVHDYEHWRIDTFVVGEPRSVRKPRPMPLSTALPLAPLGVTFPDGVRYTA